MKNAFNIDIKYSSVYSAHTKVPFYHIIKNNNIELDFPSTRCTMIIEFIFFMSEFVRRYNFIGLCSNPGWTILRISGPTLNQHYISIVKFAGSRSFPFTSYLCTRHTPYGWIWMHCCGAPPRYCAKTNRFLGKMYNKSAQLRFKA